MATTITIEQWRDQLARMVRTGAIKKGLQVAGDALAMEGQRHAVFGVTNAPGGLRVRTGALRRSLAGTTKSQSGGVDVVLSSGGKSGLGAVPYARIHEQGGRITPKKGRYLTFPVGSDSFTPAGVSRGTGSTWVSLRSVIIPPRPFLQPALEHIATKADRVISTKIQRVLEGRT